MFSDSFKRKYYDMIHLLECFIKNKSYGHDKQLIKRYLSLGNSMQKYIVKVIKTENVHFGFGFAYHPLYNTNKYFSKLKRLLNIIKSRYNGKPDNTIYY